MQHLIEITESQLRSRILKDVATSMPLIIDLDLWADMQPGTDEPRNFVRADFAGIYNDVMLYLRATYPDRKTADHACETARLTDGLNAFLNDFGTAFHDMNFVDTATKRLPESQREALLEAVKGHVHTLIHG